MQSIKAETPCYSYNITPRVLGVQGQDKSWLEQKNSEVSREMASEQNKDSGIMRTMDEMTTLVENGKEQQENTGMEDVGGKEEVEEGTVERKKEKAENEIVENAEDDKVEVEEEEFRMRRHSPRLTLPMQKREESEKSPEETRRVSPRFQGGGGKISEEAEEAKMYLFGLD